MKKIIFALLITISLHVFGQSTYTDEAGRWRLGVNMGAMWQTCDVTPHANIAGGFTIEKILNKKSDAIIGFALGLRYLSGHCTGLDTKASYGVANNTALNGTFTSQTDYAHNGGIFYNNYKTYIHEGALELKINFPRFEQKSHLILYLMGGVGICNYKTWINALDINGNRYDFTALQNAQSVTASDVSKVLNGTYSTLAQGSSPSGTNRFTPSAGIGFGFRLSRVVSLVFEYRAAFQRTNLLDGVTYNNNNDPIKQNDFYNYASAHLLFTIYGRSTKSPYANTASNTNYTNATTQTQPNTNYTNQQPAYTNQQPVYTTPAQQQVSPPYVNINSPQNNYSSTGDYISVQANIQNIQNAQQLSISQNGYPVKYFTYDSYNGNLHFQTFLQQGANNIIITANNPSGTGSQGVTIFYNPPYVPTKPHSVGNTNIGTNTAPVTQTTGVQTHTATINQPVETNTNTAIPHVITPTGNATIVIKKPVVQYINPPTSPEDVSVPTFNVSANIQNITSSSQITVNFNGSNVPQFNYNPSTKTVNFTINLLTGYNSINITANNIAGVDSKSTVIDFKPVGKPPRIDIFNPATNPFTSNAANILVSGYVYNIQSASDISVLYNGNMITFSYNNATHEIEIPVNLAHSTNQLQITASNAFGSDVKPLTLLLLQTMTTGNPHLNTNTNPVLLPLGTPIVYTLTPINGGNTNNNTGATTGSNAGVGAHHNKPEFLLTSPSSNPYTSMSGAISITANLNFIMDASKVSVSYNGVPVSFSYNPVISEHLSFTSPLKPGNNIFVINASNTYGSISESIEINYVPTNSNGNVNGNPALHFSGGANNNSNTPRSFNGNTTPTTVPTVAPPAQQQPVNGGRPVLRPR